MHLFTSIKFSDIQINQFIKKEQKSTKKMEVKHNQTSKEIAISF